MCNDQMGKGIKDLVNHSALLHDVGSLRYFLLCGELGAMLVSQSTGRCIALTSHIRCRHVLMSGVAVAILNSNANISHHVPTAARMHTLGRSHQMKGKPMTALSETLNVILEP